MQITHEQAHRLIQFNTDRALKPAERNDLAAHLEVCQECQRYAEGLQGIGSVLRPLFQRNWDQQPIPLSIAMITGKRNQNKTAGFFLATRIAVVGMIFISFVFSVWQYSVPRQPMPGLSVASVPPMPTPSTQFISVTHSSNNCLGRSYIVKESDTAEKIANHFAISKEELLKANDLSKEALAAGMEIIVPACTSTPTGTVNAQTTTYTPSSRPITSTPGG